jgi:hypothetical protein
VKKEILEIRDRKVFREMLDQQVQRAILEIRAQQDLKEFKEKLVQRARPGQRVPKVLRSQYLAMDPMEM